MIKVAWNEHYHHPLPENHRFPMVKYSLIPEQLRYEGLVDDRHFISPEPVDEKWILTVHNVSYWNRLKNLELTPREQRKTGFPHSERLILRERIICRGTIDCALWALDHGTALNVAGGTHHAYSDRGEGFCLLNDMAIASRYLLDTGLVKKVLIVDLDVHQGNGTAEIFQNDERVFTFSMHGEKNYPMRKEKSDLDIALPDQTSDSEFLSILRDQLPKLVHREKPDFIFFLSGVDVLANDKLGRLAMTIDGCRWRDEVVFEQCFNHQIPVAVAMGGGYSRQLPRIIDAHVNTFRTAIHFYE